MATNRTPISDELLRVLAYVAEHPNAQPSEVAKALNVTRARDRLLQLFNRGFVGRQPAMLRGIGGGYKLTALGESRLEAEAHRTAYL